MVERCLVRKPAPGEKYPGCREAGNEKFCAPAMGSIWLPKTWLEGGGLKRPGWS